MERHLRVLREPVDEELDEGVHVLTCYRARVDRAFPVAVTDVDGLIQEDHVRVAIPAIRVVCGALAVVADAAGTELEEQSSGRAAAWTSVFSSC